MVDVSSRLVGGLNSSSWVSPFLLLAGCDEEVDSKGKGAPDEPLRPCHKNGDGRPSLFIRLMEYSAVGHNQKKRHTHTLKIYQREMSTLESLCTLHVVLGRG